MRTERAAARLPPALALLLLVLLSARAAAQDPLASVGRATEVGSIDFRFEDGPSLPVSELEKQIALTARGGMIWLRQLLGFLPFVTPVGVHPFDPVEMQRDVVRLRRHFVRAGYPRAAVRYDVSFDAAKDLVKVIYVIRAGPPLGLGSLRFIGGSVDTAAARASPSVMPRDTAQRDSVPPRLAAELLPGWAAFTASARLDTMRFGVSEQNALLGRTVRWLRDRGYPFANAAADVVVDTSTSRAGVTVRVAPGDRARIRDIEVVGNENVADGYFVRQFPTRPGDWYSATALERGRNRIAQLNVVRIASVEVPPMPAGDSAVTVRLKVTENPEHLVRADAGYLSEGGLSTSARWTDRNFFGGARTLDLDLVAQSGLLAIESPPERLFRLSATVLQPYVRSPRLALTAGPFAEYRDDVRDESLELGFETALVFTVDPLKSISLGYGISYQRVLDYRFNDLLESEVDLSTLVVINTLGALDSLSESIDRSAFTLSGRYGSLDDLTNPRLGYVVRPRAEITFPATLNTPEYLLLDVGGTGILPISRGVRLVVKGAAGRIFPYGASTDADSSLARFAQLRDVVFTAGGSRDVRGWGSELLGPKLPAVEVQEEGDSTHLFAERYIPLGGLARLSGSVELRAALPGFDGALESFVFLDGGRVWIPGNSASPLDQQKAFSSTGLGFSYTTVAGAVQVILGYKLNPSALDVRPANEVLDAIVAGRPVTSVPTNSRLRFQLHLTIGTTF